MSALAPEIVFLPGFDGAGHLREPFVSALRAHGPTRSIDYPNRPLHSLNGYCRHVAEQVPKDTRSIVVAESFSGLVAARWAAMDPHVEALVLCGSFARNPIPWAVTMGASLPGMVRFGASFLEPLGSADPARQRWARSLSDALRALETPVIAERLRLISREDVRPELKGLRIPVLLVQFDDDQVVGRHARGELEAVCHNAQVIRFPGPHFAIETMPRECAGAIGEKIRSIAPARA
jgi:pimeloyl-[acyl-carrier protein] methyl ester esterase